MKKHDNLLVVAGFWSLLKIAVLYYSLLFLFFNSSSIAEKFMILWFGSPGLVVAALFFFIYFRPEEFKPYLWLGRLSLGLDSAISGSCLCMLGIISLMHNIAIGDPQRDALMAIICLVIVFINMLLLFLLRAPKTNSAKED